MGQRWLGSQGCINSRTNGLHVGEHCASGSGHLTVPSVPTGATRCDAERRCGCSCRWECIRRSEAPVRRRLNVMRRPLGRISAI